MSKAEAAAHSADFTIPKNLLIEPEQLTRGESIGSGAVATVYKTAWLGCTFAVVILS